MLDKQDFWERFAPLVRAEGLELFDLEIPNGNGGALRIFIAQPGLKSGGVTLDDCARGSRRIAAQQGFEDVIPDNVTLEVSSPGINRKLSRPEHYSGAIGERVKLVVYKEDGPGKMTVCGVLKSFNGEALELVDGEVDAPVRQVALRRIDDARVDFLFR